MTWRYSESFLLLLLTILTNHKSLLQESKCTFSSTWNVVIDIKVALAKGLKSPAPFHTDTMEECLDRCCTDLPVTGENRCNFMTFNPRQKNSFPNCYLFYCPTEDACPLIESTGYISHFVQRDLESMEDESTEEELSDKGIPPDQLRNFTSNLAPTKITTRQSTTVTTLQKITVQSRTSSTHTKFYTLPVTTKPLTMTKIPLITLTANPLLSLTNKPKIIQPTIHTTSTSAFLTNLLLTSPQLIRTNYQTTTQPKATSTLPVTTTPNTTALPVTITWTTTTTTPTTTTTTTLPTTPLVTTTLTTTTLPVTTTLTTTTTTLPTTLTTTTTALPVTTTQTTTTTTAITTTTTILPTTVPVTSTRTTTTTTLTDTTTQKGTTTPLTTTILPNIQLTTTDASTAKVTPKMTQQSPASKISVAKTPFIGIITVVSSKARNKLLGSHVKSTGKIEDSKVEVQSGLIAALLFGLLFLVIVMIVISKRISESYNRRHYTRVDYLINGMYIDA